MGEWMAFSVDDYVSNTMHLTTRQHGGYVLLICAAWKGKGFLPATDAGLMAVAKLTPREWKEDGATLKALLTWRGGEWVHERVEFEWNDARAIIDAKRTAGREGARKRWQGRVNGTAMADASKPHRQNDAPQPLPQPLPSVTTTLPDRSSAREQADKLDFPKPLSRAQTAHTLPDDWKPLDVDIAWLKTARPDLTPAMVEAESERFRNHAKANARTAHNWGPNWRNWMSKAAPAAEPKPKPGEATNVVTDRDGESQWQARLKSYKPGAFWLEGDWGPRPETGKCRAPANVLAEWRGAQA